MQVQNQCTDMLNQTDENRKRDSSTIGGLEVCHVMMAKIMDVWLLYNLQSLMATVIHI